MTRKPSKPKSLVASRRAVKATGRKAGAPRKRTEPRHLEFDRQPYKPSALVLINQRSGTVRSWGAELIRETVERELSGTFSALEVRLVDGDIIPDVKSAISSKKYHVVVAGGGDGTICSAASVLIGSGVTMGVLPLGTMNLFVQALGFSGSWQEAVKQFSAAQPKLVDVGFANDRAFLHQVSFGLQPRMARLRERIGYSSRFTKMLAAARAFSYLAIRPKTVRVWLTAEDVTGRIKTPLLIVSNNPLGRSGHAVLPLSLSSGKLGLYVVDEFSLLHILRMAKDYLAGRLIDNPTVTARIADEVKIDSLRRQKARQLKPKAIVASMDGEVVLLNFPVTISIKKEALNVLAMPKVDAVEGDIDGGG